MSIRRLLSKPLGFKLMVRVHQVLDWFIIQKPSEDDSESWLRQRLLLIISLGLFLVGLFFTRQIYRTNADYNSISVAVLAASGGLLIFPIWMRLTRSHILPSLLLLAEMLFVLTFLVYGSGGLDSPGLIWLSVIPIAAALLLGLRMGFLIMGVVILDVFALHILNRVSYPFPQIVPSSQIWWFQFLSMISFIGFVSMLLATYEILRQESLTHLRKLSSAIEYSPNMVLIYDTDGRIEYLNSQFTEITGYYREEIIGADVSMLGDNTREINKQIRQSLTNAGGEWRGEFLNRKADGEPYWVSVSISPARDKTGKVTHFVEVQEEITGRKKAEEQLRLQAVALESAANAIVIAERSGNIIWVNAAFTELTGYPAEEAIGRNPRLLKSGEHDGAFYAGLWQTILAGGVWRSEIINRHKDGHLYTEEMTITPVVGIGGEISHFIAIKTDITERKRAEAAAQHRNRELALLNRVISAAASELTPDTVMATICRELALAFDVPKSAAALLNETETSLEVVSAFSEGESVRELDVIFPIVDNPAVQSILASKRPLVITDILNAPGFTALHGFIEQNALVSLLILPLAVRDQMLGVIGLGTTEKREFNDEEIALAGNAVSAAAQVLENARLYAAARQNSARLTDILALSTELTTIREKSIWQDTLVTRVAALADSPTSTLMLVDEAGEEAVLAAQIGLPEDSPMDLRIPLSLPVFHHSLMTGDPIIVPDIDRDAPDLRAVLVREDIQSFFAYPLLRRGWVLGFITLSSLKSRKPSESEVTAYRLLSERVAAALENVHLLGQLRQSNLELNRLHRASGALFSGGLSGIEDLALDIVETIQREFEHANCSLFLIEERSSKVRRIAAAGPYAAQLSEWTFPIAGKGLVPAVVRTGSILNVPDVKAHPDYAPGWSATCSELTIPLKIDDRVIGAIDLQSVEPAHFNPDDERLLVAFAERAALALQNARLFAESNRRTEELETLHQASLQLTSSLEQKEVLTSILSYAIQLASAKDAHAFLYDEQKLSFGAAVWVNDEGNKEVYREPRPGGLTETVARSGQRFVIPDVNAHPLFEDWQWGGAIIGLPLSVGGLVLGVMNIAFSKPRVFEENELWVLDLLAAQAAVALDNTRLFNETRRRAEELEAMVKVSSALRHAQTLSAMLAIILDEVFDLLNAQGAALAMHDPVTEETVIELARGDWSGVTGLRVPPGHSIAERFTYGSGNMAGVHMATPLDSSESSGPNGQSVAASVPLIAEDETIGVLWVGREEGITRGEIQLLTAIGDIAANAIQRAKLHEQMVSHAAELERRVTERTTELSIINAQLARANRAKDEFLANMSHELRTPLSNVLLRVEMLQEGTYGQLSEKQARSLATVEESGRHLLQLINDILDVSKIEAGKLDLAVQPISAESICQSSLQLVREMVQEKQIQVHTAVQPIMLKADGRRLKQILVNLLTNAVKFTPEGAEIGLETILDAEEETVRFVVWDTGVGIAPEDMGDLFEPFTQIDGGLTRKYEGTGLGLALVRRLTEMHGGSVTVESVVGQGSRFTVSLPWYSEGQVTGGRERETTETEKEGSNVAQPVAPSTGNPATILLAEDNGSMINGLVDYLALKGHHVIVARNGAEAVELATEDAPDLILMDIQMPGMDGLEAIRRIRAAKSRVVPIIALTALAMPGDRERCLEAGAAAYLSKPVSLSKLHTEITSHLENAGGMETRS